MSKLRHVRIKLPEANAFVSEHHRHHKPVIGHLFSLGAVYAPCGGECVMAGCPVENCRKLVGVAIVGRPVARMRDDGETAELPGSARTAPGTLAASFTGHQLELRSHSASGVSELTSSPAKPAARSTPLAGG